jgi:Ca2+-transporting ATPase
MIEATPPPVHDDTPSPRRWYALAPSTVAAALDATPATGLTLDEVARRVELHGPNRLAEPEPRAKWLLFIDQFRQFLVYVLFGAAVVSLLVGDIKDPIVIGIVLLINAILGFVQEAKAETAMASLKEMLVTQVRVRRGGQVEQIPADDLVPGDLVLLEAGDRVPADGRLLEAVNLSVDEAAFTGESVPTQKHVDVLPNDDLPIGDRSNLGFMNTTVVRGRGELLVTETGMATEMGRIAGLLNEAEQGPTPLQVQLEELGKRLALIAFFAVSLVFILQKLDGAGWSEAAIGAVALAVAAIPEGLPAVVTVTLAVGTSQMAKRNAIVKRLHSVETLGSTTVICSDKTGTLTLNQMTARTVVRGLHTYEVSGQGYDMAGTIEGADSHDIASALRGALLCNDATVRDGELVGDPTEGAMLVVAAKAGFDPVAERADHPRVGEVPFDSAVKFMATFHRDGDDVVMYAKGAPDVLLARSARLVMAGGTAEPIADHREAIARHNDDIAARGLRVLAVASRRWPASEVLDADGHVIDPDSRVAGLDLEALVGIVDPPRAEARDAIALCRRAGISVKMITGDHAITAQAIASDLGIVGRAVTGAELDVMSDDELAEQIDDIGVCARVSPEHKVRVVKALQANGHVVAMTGDGVNDAAALRTADIGVAMGITGTEVTKEAGDMVLADDNFATIVGAVERGRTIYDNIVKFVRFQLGTNISAIATFLVASGLGMPVPFTAIQVLFVNIIADGPPAMSLGVDPPSAGIMDRQPRPTGSPILSMQRLRRLSFAAAVISAGTLLMLSWAPDRYGDEVGLTMVFTTFVFFQLCNVFNARTTTETVFSRYAFVNRTLWLAVGGVVFVQVLAVHVPFLQNVFDTAALTPIQWVICAATAFTVILADELRKAVVRARS